MTEGCGMQCQTKRAMQPPSPLSSASSRVSLSRGLFLVPSPTPSSARAPQPKHPDTKAVRMRVRVRQPSSVMMRLVTRSSDVVRVRVGELNRDPCRALPRWTADVVLMLVLVLVHW